MEFRNKYHRLKLKLMKNLNKFKKCKMKIVIN